MYFHCTPGLSTSSEDWAILFLGGSHWSLFIFMLSLPMLQRAILRPFPFILYLPPSFTYQGGVVSSIRHCSFPITMFPDSAGLWSSSFQWRWYLTQVILGYRLLVDLEISDSSHSYPLADMVQPIFTLSPVVHEVVIIINDFMHCCTASQPQNQTPLYQHQHP